MELRDTAIRMMERGIDIPTISEILEVDADSLTKIRETLDITIKQDDVVEAMNRLAWKAYERGLEILHVGTPNMQMALIRMMLSQMRGLMGSQSPKQMAELIDRFKESIEMHEEDEEEEGYSTDDVPEDMPDE